MPASVHEMFARIAPRYDLINTVLSLGIHHSWRRRAVELSHIQPGERALDCATGTGDLAFALADRCGVGGFVVATDFCEPMLDLARKKQSRRGTRIDFQAADATRLPYEAGQFDVATIAFGIRNVDDPIRCLSELGRAVRPGGRVVVLEFGQPRLPVFSTLYKLYSRYLMPRIGGFISGDPSAYRYLPQTAAAFPCGSRFLELMQQTGSFAETEATPLWFGIAYVYVGVVK